MLTVGVDIGGSHISAGVVDSGYRIISRANRRPCVSQGAEAVARDIALCVRQAVYGTGAAMSEVGAIGVGSPGVCDPEAGTVTMAHNLGFTDVPLRALLARELGMDIYLDNDASCAALGETLAGAARGCKNVLMVTLGTGVGGGFVIDGRIYSGFRSLGGEIGHMCVAMGGERCSCGERGCWEAYASATALVRQAERAAAEDPSSALGLAGRLDGERIFALARGGDAAAGRVLAGYCEYVGVGIVGLINAFYPEMIILGGGISAGGELLLKPVSDYVAAHFFVGRRELMPALRIAALGNDAGVIGASALCEK